MAETKTQLERDSRDELLGAILANANAVNKGRGTRRTQAAAEPQMRALRRILGDTVLDLFPQAVMDTIDALIEIHAADTSAYAEAAFDTEQDRDDCLTLMRAYAECADQERLSIRQDKDTDATALRFRVVVRKDSQAE